MKQLTKYIFLFQNGEKGQSGVAMGNWSPTPFLFYCRHWPSISRPYTEAMTRPDPYGMSTSITTWFTAVHGLQYGMYWIGIVWISVEEYTLFWLWHYFWRYVHRTLCLVAGNIEKIARITYLPISLARWDVTDGIADIIVLMLLDGRWETEVYLAYIFG